MQNYRVSTSNRWAVIIVVDCSLSMQQPMVLNHTPMRKIDTANIIVNNIIDELVARASRKDNVRNYFDIAVLGYSGSGTRSLLTDADSDLVSVTALAEQRPQPEQIYIKQRLGAEGDLEDVPFTLYPWVRLSASGISPMYDALQRAKLLAKEWCESSRLSYCVPPIIFHITDGGCSDATELDLIELSREIQEVGPSNGKVLLYNVHLVSDDDLLPCEYHLPRNDLFYSHNPESMTLFKMSSVMPNYLNAYVNYYLCREEGGLRRTFSINTIPTHIISAINIGSINHVIY